MRQAEASIRPKALACVAADKSHRLNLILSFTTDEEFPSMTRTPTTSVTANAFAARAFAWGNLIGAHVSRPLPGIAPPLPQSPKFS